MKITHHGGVTIIADDSSLAVDIRSGKDIHVNSDGSITSKVSTGKLTNHWQILAAIKTADSIPEIKKILTALTQISIDGA